MSDMKFSTRLTEAGAYFERPADHPEALPIHLSTAHNVKDLKDLQRRYDNNGHCYNRNSNPDRTELCTLMNTVEGAQASQAFNCGMAAISSTLLTLTKAGDHILSDKTLYGETIEIFTNILEKYGVETTFVDFLNPEEVKQAVKPNTVLFYTETESNPLISWPDLQVIADIAHENNALLVVDNTFMTGALVHPLEFGADVVVNSLTKFANGHSDSLTGAASSNQKDLITQIYDNQVLLGTEAPAFDAWLTMRGMRTLDLRIHKASDNALAIAQSLEKNPHVKNVFYAGLESSPYHDIAVRETGGKYFGGMLTLEFEEDFEKLNTFVGSLQIAHYAMTLGGYRSTMSYPPMSSHENLTREERYDIGITDGMLRFSIGIEDTDDLVADFNQAVEKAYG